MELNEDTLDVFRDDVTSFAQIDRLIENYKGQLKPIQEKIKELRNQKKELEGDICSTLGRNSLKQIESPDIGVVLEYQVKKSMVPITQKTVKEKMQDFYKLPHGPGSDLSFNSKSPEEKGLEMFAYIYGKENRNYKETEKLKVKPIQES